MKAEIHPDNYRLVAFKDMSNEDVFITKSTVNAKETLEVDGVEYPLVKLEISRTSHPFYTGKSKLVDTAGRIDKFKNKYAVSNTVSVRYVTLRPNAGLYRMAKKPIGVPIKFNETMTDANKTYNISFSRTIALNVISCSIISKISKQVT